MLYCWNKEIGFGTFWIKNISITITQRWFFVYLNVIWFSDKKKNDLYYYISEKLMILTDTYNLSLIGNGTGVNYCRRLSS